MASAVHTPRGRVFSVSKEPSASAFGKFPTPPSESSSSKFDIARVLKLLTHPNTSEARERHIAAINRLGSHYSCYGLSHLSTLGKIVEISIHKAEGGMNPSYYEAIGNAMIPLSKAYQKDKGTHASMEESTVLELLDVIALSLKNCSSDLLNVMLGVVLKFFRGCAIDPNESKHVVHARQDKHVQLVSKSKIPAELAQICANMADDSASSEIGSFAHTAFFVLAELTRSGACSAAVVASGHLGKLTLTLKASKSRDFIASAIETLWNIIESDSEAAAMEALATAEAAEAIAQCFRHFMFNADASSSRQLRNDIVTVITLLVRGAPAPMLANTTVVEDVLRGVTWDFPAPPDSRKMRLTTTVEDFEFHREALILVRRLAKVESCRPAIASSRFFGMLFAYFPEGGADAKLRRWTLPQKEELELLSIATLASVVAYFAEDFHKLGGNERLLDLFAWCMGKTGVVETQVVVPETEGSRIFRGAGNSALSAGDFNLKTQGANPAAKGRRAHGLQCLKVLFNLVSASGGIIEEIKNDAVLLGAMDALRQFLMYSLESADRFEITMRTEALYVLSKLCEGTLHNKELFGTPGVKMVLNYIEFDSSLYAQGLGHVEATAAAVSLVWSAINGCSANEVAFIEREGIFSLLDLLDIGPLSLRNLILGCLLDLSENERALPCVIEWRSSANMNTTAAHLLVQLWRQEEAKFGVDLADNFIAPDTDAPLMPGGWSPDTGEGCTSVEEVSRTKRSKIYAILKKTGWDVYPGLTAYDRVTIESIRSYLLLKQGEVWLEIDSKLRADGIVPTEVDQDLLELAMASNKEALATLRNRQADIILSEEQAAQNALDSTYNEIEMNHRTAQSILDKQDAFISRTANHDTLKAAAAAQKEAIAVSRRACSPGRHDTTDHHAEIVSGGLTTTTFSKKIVLTASLIPGADGRELAPHVTRGKLEILSTLTDAYAYE